MKSVWSKLIMAFMALTVLVGGAHLAGYRVNLTGSLPRGLYRIVPATPRTGDLVAFTLPDDHPSARRMARPYLKRLVAIYGDLIHVAPAGISVNGKLLPNTRAKNVDRMGNALPRLLVPGPVPPGKALVLSTHHQYSFDGRYFGLLDMDRLHAVTPIFTFN
jgi:conjugative transfer signal peptidase TraF